MSDQTFLSDENGAVTVDWVVMTAALVGLALAVMTAVRGGVADLSGEISTLMADYEIETTFRESFPWDISDVWPLGGDSPTAADPNYEPFDQANYDMLVAVLRGLDTDQLQATDGALTQGSRLAVQSELTRRDALLDWQQGRVDDTEGALALVLGERGVERWSGRGASEASINALSVEAGLSEVGIIVTSGDAMVVGQTGG